MVSAVNASSLVVMGKQGTTAGSSFLINANQTVLILSRFEIIKEPVSIVNVSQFSSRANQSMVNSAFSRAFTNTGRTLFARNTDTDVITELGFIPEGQTTLTDVALADGFYEVEVRTSNDFWQEARSKVRFTIQITSGVIEFQGLPNIENLRTVITNGFGTSIRFNIPNVNLGGGFEFGIWSSATSPVDVSGVPDEIIVAFEGTGSYRKTVTQTTSLFYAVAAFDDIDQGIASEVFQEWDLTAPNAPSDQFAY